MEDDAHSGVTRGLWLAFAALFAVVAAASFGPVEPVVWILPAWAVVVVGAMVAAAAVAALAGRVYGWPPVEAGRRDGNAGGDERDGGDAA